MKKYNRNNIKGLTFNAYNVLYEIVESLPYMHIKKVGNSWENKDYDNPELIINNLNNGFYTNIKEVSLQIHELW